MSDPVFVYALSTCPWCRKAKQYFEENGVVFEAVDVDLLRRRRERPAGRRGLRALGFARLSRGEDRRRGGRRLRARALRAAPGDRDLMGHEARTAVLREFFAPLVGGAGLQVHARPASSPTFCSSRRRCSKRPRGRRTAPARSAPASATHDMKIVCPCIPYHRAHFDAMRRCWCGLFVHNDVTDPDAPAADRRERARARGVRRHVD